MFKHRENQAELIKSRPFLFEETKSDILKDDYFAWAIAKLKKAEKNVHIFDAPHAYKFDILDKYRKRLVCTNYNPTQSGVSLLASVFQLSEYEHAIMSLHFDVEDLKKDFASVVLLSSEKDALLRFMNDNENLIESFESARSIPLFK